MAGPLILIGLDAAEASALALGPDDDRFPTLAGLRRRGAYGSLVGQHEYLTDTVWPEIRTGSSGIRTGIYYAPLQFRSGEWRARRLGSTELVPDHFYWNIAADAGARVAAIDQPLVAARESGKAAEIAGWGTHDRPFGRECSDAALARILEQAGPHPVGECNRMNNGKVTGRRRLLAAIHEGIERRTELVCRALAADTWDLFTAVYGESHCVGHHYWPSVAGEPGHVERGVPGTQVIESVYRHLDSALGRVVASAPASATVIVYASHGMAPTDEGAFLIGDVLERLGMVPGNRRRRRLAALVPERLRGAVRRVMGGSLLQQAGLTADRGLGAATTRAVPLPNSRHGAIRLALAGRDPGGTLEPGSADYHAVLNTIRSAFGELTLSGSEEKVVSEVLLTDDLFGAGRHPDLPDILVRFRTDLGIIGEVRSARVGTIRLIRHSHRTGEHGTPGAVWMQGPGIPAGTELRAVRAVDIAPTVLSHLGIPVPEWVDGSPFFPVS